MKILILIIYSENEYYREMLGIQKKYIHKNCNCESYFIQFKEDMCQDIEIIDDFIYVKGTEHLLKMTEKTIKSLKHLFFTLNKQYDYIVRTNISTIINHHLLISNLEKMSRTNIYIGGNLLNLQWLDHPLGIFDDKYFGTIFVQGTGIVLSKDVMLDILKNDDKLDYNIADDVGIAVYIKKYNNDAFQNMLLYELPILIYDKTHNIDSIANYVFIRNKIFSKNRKIDITNMNNQVQTLYY